MQTNENQELSENLEALRSAVDFVSDGYAADLLTGFLAIFDPDASMEDYEGLMYDTAGDLFRTLVLDENFSVEEAQEVWAAACGVLDAYNDHSEG